MTEVSLPLWLFLLLAALAAYGLVVSILFPGLRWMVRRRLNQAIERLNTQLQVQIRPFQRTRRQALIDRLVFDREVVAAAELTARQEGVDRETVQARIVDYASEITPSFNAYFYFRLGYRLARTVSRFLYRVRTRAVSPDRLGIADQEATVVFIMNHRSNMDYLLVSYLVADQVSLSYAVGEWARFFPLESLIRSLGAFFVRRNSGDALYRKVLERYVDMATREGVSQAVYLEGGLSRDGTMGPPKLGFLDYLLRNFDDAGARDLLFVPIGINYDHVLEDVDMVTWTDPDRRRGAWQQTKTVLRFLRTHVFMDPRNRWRKFGYANVHFGVPLSTKAYCRERDVHFRRLERESRFAAVADLAQDLMTRIRHVMPILPVPLICTLFAEAPALRLRASELYHRIEQLADDMIAAGAAMKPDEKPKLRTLQEALTMLRERQMLVEEDDRFQANPAALDLIRYYANSIAHWRQDIGGARH